MKSHLRDQMQAGDFSEIKLLSRALSRVVHLKGDVTIGRIKAEIGLLSRIELSS
jgi:hypothetical protein